MKKKTLIIILTVLPAAAALYTGISCMATWHKAAAQPHLVYGDESFVFLGYYITSVLLGALSLALVTALVFIRKRTK